MNIDKLTAFYLHTVNESIYKENMPENLVVSVKMNELPLEPDALCCTGGYFSHNDINNLSKIAPIVTNRNQTLAHYTISA